MHEPARLATTAVSLPAASERLDIENSGTAPSRPLRARQTSLECARNGAQAEAPLDETERGHCSGPGVPYLLRAVA